MHPRAATGVHETLYCGNTASFHVRRIYTRGSERTGTYGIRLRCTPALTTMIPLMHPISTKSKLQQIHQRALLLPSRVKRKTREHGADLDAAQASLGFASRTCGAQAAFERRRQESQRALAKISATLVSPHPSTKVYKLTEVTRGEATDTYNEMKMRPVLKVTPKPPPATAESLQTRKCRKAALARWHPSTNRTESVGDLTGLKGEARQLVPAASEVRYWRRGESKTDRGSYRQASATEMLEVIDKLTSKPHTQIDRARQGLQGKPIACLWWYCARVHLRQRRC